MKKYLIILLIAITTLTGCATQSDNQIPDNQIVVSNVQSIYLSNAIGSINNDIFNKIIFEDIISKDIEKLVLVQNEVPFLKSDLSKLDDDVHKALRKATVRYQKILNKYSNKLVFPLTYPNKNNYYTIEKAGIDILFDNYGDLISIEIDNAMNELFKEPIKEFNELSTNYNIYCESLEALDRQFLSKIDTDITIKLKKLFLDNIYSSIITSERSYYYERNSFEPYKITITK
jgi:hypothetical protein